MKRPFRIFDEGAKRDLPRRSYKTIDKGLDKMLSILWRLEVGNTFTLYSVEGYKGVIQLTRRIHGIEVLSDPSLRFGSHLPSARELYNRLRVAGASRH